MIVNDPASNQQGFALLGPEMQFISRRVAFSHSLLRLLRSSAQAGQTTAPLGTAWG